MQPAVGQGRNLIAAPSALAPGCSVNARDHLCSADCDLVELVAEFGTPLYVFNEPVIRERCRQWREAFRDYAGGADVAYAAKAGLTLALARLISQEDLHLDVVSGGELFVALRAGMPAARIHVHGNNKPPQEIAEALDAGVGRFVVDNFDELAALEREAAHRHRRQAILLRVAPGIEAHTHDYIRTGSQASKFGFDLQTGQALEAARRAEASPHLHLMGLHAHIGSQILDVSAVTPLVATMLDLWARMASVLGRPLEELNLGGGAGIRYAGERTLPPAEVAEAMGRAVTDGCAERGLPLPRLAVEPGRSIVGEAGVALYTVGTQKHIPGLVSYVAVDGGMGDNIRPALYGAEYTVVLANRMSAPPSAAVHVVGRYCESGDFLARGALLPALEAGDLLAFYSAGAYQYPMASNYNLVPRPCVLLVEGGRAHVMVARETYADLIARDRLPAHLLPEDSARA